jgi:hypothetical protein
VLDSWGGCVPSLTLGSAPLPHIQNPDIQLSVGLTSGVPVTFISTGTLPNDLVTEMLDQAHYLLSMNKPPQTILNTDLPGLESQVASPQMAVCAHLAFSSIGLYLPDW